MKIQKEVELIRPQAYLFNHIRSLNLLLAGKGTGKTFFAGMISGFLIHKFPQCKGFIAANTHEQLNTSTFTRVLEVWDKFFGWTEYNKTTGTGNFVTGKMPPAHFKKIHKFKDYGNIVSFKSGAIIFLASLENAKAHEGKEFAWAILDETKDSREQDVKDTILTRLRQSGICLNEKKELSETGENICPMFVLTSPARVQWLNDWFDLDQYRGQIESVIYDRENYFRKSTDKKTVVIAATYHNQVNLPANYIEGLVLSNTSEKVKQIVWGSPFATAGKEYITAYNPEIHLRKEIEYDPDAAIHLTFDFNVTPYNTCSVWQINKENNRWKVRGLFEVALKPPENQQSKMCQSIDKILTQVEHKAGIFIYGDATGRNRNIAYEEYKHHYDVIEKKLHKYLSNNSMRVSRTNPPNVKRRDFINLIFEGKLPIDIEISKQMIHTIEDIIYCQVDADGGKEKKHVKDEEHLEGYEKYGHFLDALEYFLCSVFKQYMKNMS